MGYVLEAIGLEKKYGGVTVLDNVSMKVERGKAKVIMGPNGAGKTTLLKCLNLLVKPDRGKVLLDGVDVTSPDVDVYKVRRRMGYVPQDAGLFSHMTVLDNVMLGPLKVKKMSRAEALRVAAWALDSVGIDRSMWKRYPAQLSGGQRQRVAIARALAMEPEVILYDEPTANLDPVAAAEVAEIVISLARAGVTSLIVTHDIGLAMAVGGEVLLLNRRVVYEGPLARLLNRDAGESIADPDVTRFLAALSSSYRKQCWS
jgi:polar amino acid transport system ATP-binding protein